MYEYMQVVAAGRRIRENTKENDDRHTALLGRIVAGGMTTTDAELRVVVS